MRLIIGFLIGVLLVNNPAFGGTITDKNGNITFTTFEGQDMQRLVSLKGESLLKQLLPLSSVDNYNKVTESTDALGMSHEKFQQFYGQLPVEFGVFTLHYGNGKAKIATGEYVVVDENCLKLPTIGANDALQLAKKHIGATKYMWEDEEMETFLKIDKNDAEATFFPKPKLVYIKDFLGGNEKARLAFKFDIYAQIPVGRSDVYVDAENGNILFENKTIHHADEVGIAETRYSGTKNITTFNNGSIFQLKETGVRNCETYNLKRGTNYNGAKLFTDTDNNWTATEYNNLKKDNAALDAHYGAELSWDYWKDIHSRDSYDGIGGTIKSYVHYGQNYDNAFWDGERMTYGDGSGEIFDALTSLDVVGHEIGHGVCEKTANLIYAGESGGMNEGYSDIWAACIEYHNGRTQDQVWKIGEDIERRPDHIALRVMSNPNLEKNPDTYLGEFWYDEVHNTSGIFNYWFYLLSIGGIGVNDNGNAYNVAGISIEKAEKIAFRAEKEYMTPSTNFVQAREITIQCAKDLFGANAPEVKSVDDAWYAVGIAAPCNIGINMDDWAFKFIDVGENDATFYIENNLENDKKMIIDYIDENNLNDGKTLTADLISGDTFKMVGLKNCTNYYLTLKIVCSSGIAFQTNLKSFVKTLGCVCNQIEDLQIYNVTLFDADVYMKSAGPADSIEISYRKIGESNWITHIINNYFGDFNVFSSVDNLTPNTNYELKARYLCNFEWQKFSEPVFFTTLKIECGSSNSFQLNFLDQISALFSAVPYNGTVRDKFKYKKVIDSEFLVKSYAIPTQGFPIFDLLPNTQYMAFLESTCFDSTLYQTDTIYFKTKPFTCTSGTIISLVGEPKPTEVTLKWFGQGVENEYELNYFPAVVNAVDITINTGIDTFLTITGLGQDQFYYAKVRPKCNGTWKRWSGSFFFKTPLSTGLIPVSNNTISLSIYPNPTNGNVKIISNQSVPNKLIRIADIMGKTVYEKTINLEKNYPTELDLNHLSQGTYFIYSDFEGNKIASKLVIIR